MVNTRGGGVNSLQRNWSKITWVYRGPKRALLRFSDLCDDEGKMRMRNLGVWEWSSSLQHSRAVPWIQLSAMQAIKVSMKKGKKTSHNEKWEIIFMQREGSVLSIKAFDCTGNKPRTVLIRMSREWQRTIGKFEDPAVCSLHFFYFYYCFALRVHLSQVAW